MNQRRVCDACAVRRIRCDGLAPCAGCTNAELDCTRVRPRIKSGPKGVKKRTLEKLAKVKQAQPPRSLLQPEDLRSLNASNRAANKSPSSLSAVIDNVSQSYGRDDSSTASWPQCQNSLPEVLPSHDEEQQQWTYPYGINVDHLLLYLDIFHHKLYPVWPIVNKDVLTTRLCAGTPDVETYILASSVCIATVLQLQLTATDAGGSILDSSMIMEEIETLRRSQDYREHPSMDALRSSFFLHVAYLHMKKQRTSTLTLRESISMAHMLDLHKLSHYELLSFEEANHDLRVLWLLFITER